MLQSRAGHHDTVCSWWPEARSEQAALNVRPLRPASVPPEIIVPLDQHAGAASVPLVQKGDTVLLGQPIAQPQADISAWLHSPVSGTVTAIELRPVAHHSLNTMCIVIANDGLDSRFAAHLSADFQSLSPDDLCEHIARGGIVGLGGATFPTAAKLRQAGGRERLHLLLNGAECEPWISCDDVADARARCRRRSRCSHPAPRPRCVEVHDSHRGRRAGSGTGVAGCNGPAATFRSPSSRASIPPVASGS